MATFIASHGVNGDVVTPVSLMTMMSHGEKVSLSTIILHRMGFDTLWVGERNYKTKHRAD